MGKGHFLQDSFALYALWTLNLCRLAALPVVVLVRVEANMERNRRERPVARERQQGRQRPVIREERVRHGNDVLQERGATTRQRTRFRASAEVQEEPQTVCPSIVSHQLPAGYESQEAAWRAWQWSVYLCFYQNALWEEYHKQNLSPSRTL